MVFLPRYMWFYQLQGRDIVTNIYTSSDGTDPSQGCTNATTFNYKVFVNTKEDPAIFVAECFWQFPWDQTPMRSEVVTNTFENSEEGLKQVQEWLEAEQSKLKITIEDRD